jgi:transposase-like protein
MNQATALGLESDQNQGKKGAAAAARWRRLVEDHRVSGLPVSAFCRDRGISQSSLFAWRRRLAAAQRGGETAGKFLEVTSAAVAVESKPRAAAAAADHAAADEDDASFVAESSVAAATAISGEASFVELRLPGERRLIVRRGFDRQLLLDLVNVLESSSSAWLSSSSSRPAECSRSRRGAAL